jgi:hypothetical protein
MDAVSICPESILDYPKLYAEAICRKRVQCCANDTETCMKEVSDGLALLYPDLDKSEQEGSAEANCPALEACITAVDAAECSDWPLEMPILYGVPAGEPACRNIIKGKIGATKPCASTYQCNNGFCSEEPAGTCIGFIADGQPCTDDSFCNLATSFCNASNLCAPRKQNGEVCTSGDDCQSRRCDTQDSGKCLAPPSKECAFVPKACSFGRAPLRDGLAWPLLMAGLALGVGTRRRARARSTSGAGSMRG